MGERLSSVFSPDGTLISASAASHCRVEEENEMKYWLKFAAEQDGGKKERVEKQAR